MYPKPAAYGHIRAPRSQMGASFSIALLIMLFCIALSAAIIAAATASTGTVADSSAKAARYNAVMSAAGLFSDSVADGASYTYEQRIGSDSSSTITLKSAPEYDGFRFLDGITDYAFFGSSGEASSPGAFKAAPFSDGVDEVSFSYTVEPDVGTAAGTMDVQVDCKLRTDWTVQLDFHSTEENADKQFHCYMILAASTGETQSTQGTGSHRVKTKIWDVDWKIRQLVPGRAGI